MTKAEAEAHQRKHGFLPLTGSPECHDEAMRQMKDASAKLRRRLDATQRMNKTEREFAMILKAQKRHGEILRWEYEGITLRWADMRYTPDFLVVTKEINATDQAGFVLMVGRMFKFIEVKGAKIWDRDIVRFKGARAYWPEFEFEMHQRDKEGRWTRLH